LDEKVKRKFDKITKIGISLGGKYSITLEGQTYILKPSEIITIPANKEFEGVAVQKTCLGLEASK
jgi:hypothetical protein